MTEELTYTYCLVAAEQPPAVEEAPEGPPGAGPTRALELGGDRWLVVAGVPREEYRAEAINARLKDLDWVGRCAMAHEAVVEHFLAATVIPMRLFTIFESDERARRHVVAQRAQIEATIDRICDHDEWGVRVLIDPAEAVRRARARSTGSGDGRSGKAFLMRKKAQQDAGKEAVERARAEALAVAEALADLASEVRARQEAPEDVPSRAIVDAAFLVSRERATEFERVAEAAMARLEDAGCSVSLTGPWPAYNFLAP